MGWTGRMGCTGRMDGMGWFDKVAQGFSPAFAGLDKVAQGFSPASAGLPPSRLWHFGEPRRSSRGLFASGGGKACATGLVLFALACSSKPPDQPKDYVGKIAAERAAKDAS